MPHCMFTLHSYTAFTPLLIMAANVLVKHTTTVQLRLFFCLDVVPVSSDNN